MLTNRVKNFYSDFLNRVKDAGGAPFTVEINKSNRFTLKKSITSTVGCLKKGVFSIRSKEDIDFWDETIVNEFIPRVMLGVHEKGLEAMPATYILPVLRFLDEVKNEITHFMSGVYNELIYDGEHAKNFCPKKAEFYITFTMLPNLCKEELFKNGLIDIEMIDSVNVGIEKSFLADVDNGHAIYCKI